MSEYPLLDEVIHFHGHSCPGLISGYRVAMAVRDRFGPARSEDEELVAVVENDSCAVDAVQVILGCTFGKGNLIFKDHGKHVYTFFRRDGSNRALRIRVKKLSLPPDATREQVTEALLTAKEGDLLSITEVPQPPPRPARIEPSQPCHQCGEETMESRLRVHQGQLLCIPCWEQARAGAG
jgi:formylmethanofuran dehydrogenase subunit E